MASRGRLLIQRILLVIVGVALLTGLVAYSQGAVIVYVHEKKPEGHRIWVPAPALLVDLGVRFVPEERLRDALQDLRPWLPAIEAAGHELERSPDGLLVEVKDRTDHVMVSKGGDVLRVDVDSETETVHVSVPISLIESVAERLGTSGGAV
ncbi:MAG: hypothetical protein DMG25_01225 [Acidobacteria bacterium]|nr:MAG: hypothetical protein DMG25_01225 [Acidobacteriota bacterium]PYV27077.1 MAG: hypothetical protein DMG27_04920 [Acidobacteriota bacterium]